MGAMDSGGLARTGKDRIAKARAKVRAVIPALLGIVSLISGAL
jgi:hypothetical protein